jgi:hypothetical protein
MGAWQSPPTTKGTPMVQRTNPDLDGFVTYNREPVNGVKLLVRCEPTADRSAIKYGEPTPHRSLEGQAEPPLLVGSPSVKNASTGTSRSLGCFPTAVALGGPITKIGGNSTL